MTDNGSVPHDPAAFSAWTEERIRFADTDMLGHVNHAAIVTLFEIGRGPLAFSAKAKHLFPPGTATVVRVLTVEYLGELRYPGKVKIGMRVARVGRTSFVIEQLLLDDARVAATAILTYVLADLANARSTPIPEDLRAYLVSLS